MFSLIFKIRVWKGSETAVNEPLKQQFWFWQSVEYNKFWIILLSCFWALKPIQMVDEALQDFCKNFVHSFEDWITSVQEINLRKVCKFFQQKKTKSQRMVFASAIRNSLFLPNLCSFKLLHNSYVIFKASTTDRSTFLEWFFFIWICFRRKAMNDQTLQTKTFFFLEKLVESN